MLFKRVPVPIERELHRSLFSMLEMDEGDAEEMGPAPSTEPTLIICVRRRRWGASATRCGPIAMPPDLPRDRPASVPNRAPIYKSWASVCQQGLLAESVEA
jgi:hypothetical protein